MDFIDEENDFAMVLQLFDEAPQTFLKLTSVLRACHDGCHIECHDAFVGNHVWHLAPDDALRQPLDEGRFADAGLANQNGIVLLSSGENLRHALYLPAASDDGVQHAVACRLRQVSAEVVDDGRIAFGRVVFLVRCEARLLSCANALFVFTAVLPSFRHFKKQRNRRTRLLVSTPREVFVVDALPVQGLAGCIGGVAQGSSQEVQVGHLRIVVQSSLEVREEEYALRLGIGDEMLRAIHDSFRIVGRHGFQKFCAQFFNVNVHLQNAVSRLAGFIFEDGEEQDGRGDASCAAGGSHLQSASDEMFYFWRMILSHNINSVPSYI